MQIRTVRDLMRALRSGPYVWPGGYPLFFFVSDGEALSFKTVRENVWRVARSVRDQATDGWCVVACDVNWEDVSLTDAHTGEQIESAYGEDQRE